MGFPKTWTTEEELYLVENGRDMSAAEIAQHLGKTKKAVIMKRYYMTHGYRSTDDVYEPVYMTKEEKIYRLQNLAKELRVKLKRGE